MALAVVFGANGFIGSHVSAAMAGVPDLEIVGAGLGAPTPALADRWIDLDMAADDGRLESELRAAQPQVIVNCAGATAGSTAQLFRLNVLTTSALLQAIAGSGVAARLIHVGSAAEYGPGEPGLPVAESACAGPLGEYGISKLAATQLVVAAGAAGCDATVLRIFNALGPGMPEGTLPRSAHRRLTEAVAARSNRVEMGPLGAVRDFVDVRDIGAAAVAAWLAPGPLPVVINIGSGIGHTARKLVEVLAARLEFRGEIGERAAGSPRSGEVPWQVADVRLAERELGWRARHDLASSVDWMVCSPT